MQPLFKEEFKHWFIIAIMTVLSACSTHENQLAEREAMIQARESELVDLFAEVVELKKSLENKSPEKPGGTIENSGAAKIDDCSCNTANAVQSQSSPAITDQKTLIGGIENVYLDPPGLEFSARIDTGAKTSSLNAIDIVEFERDGKPFVKFKLTHPETGELLELTRRLRRYVRIKERGDRDAQRRPVVKMRVALANIDEQIDFTLENRSKFKYQVLIGRNFLNDLAIVDVSKQFTTVKTDATDHSDIK